MNGPPAPRLLPLTQLQLSELELLYLQYPLPSPSHILNFISHRSSLAPLDPDFLTAWFSARRLKEEQDAHLSSLIHENLELEIEHQSLIFRNKELRNQTILLDLENQRLKEQLEKQLQRRQSSPSSIVTDAESVVTEECCSLEMEFSEPEIICSSDDLCNSSCRQ